MFETKFVEKIKIHFIFKDLFFESHAFYEIIWKIKNTVGQATDDKKRMSYWIHKATNTHSEYVTRIAFRCNNVCFNVHHCYVIHTLSDL